MSAQQQPQAPATNIKALPRMQAPPNPKAAMQGLEQLRKELNQAFVQRGEIVDALCDALVAGHHVCLLGPPGTGKSALARAFASALQGKHFELLLTRYTGPDEVFGPISVRGIAERDEVQRKVEGFLPTATTAFLDEIFKANSAILNSLLTALNERTFSANPAQGPQAIPLAMVVGASNELPEDDVQALWDRFSSRFWIDRIKDRNGLMQILNGSQSSKRPGVTAKINEADLAAAQDEASEVQVPSVVAELLVDTVLALREKGINPSERAMVQALQLAKARAYRNGRTVASPGDLLVMQSMFWNKPQEAPIVRDVVLKTCFPLQSDLQRIADIAKESYSKELEPLIQQTQGTVDSRTKMKVTNAVILVTEQIASQRQELQALIRQYPDHQDAILEVDAELAAMDQECLTVQANVMRRRVSR